MMDDDSNQSFKENLSSGHSDEELKDNQNSWKQVLDPPKK